MKRCFRSNNEADMWVSQIFTSLEGKRVFLKTPHGAALQRTSALEDVCKELSNSDEIVFNSKGKNKLSCSDLGGRLLKIVGHADFENIENYFPECQFNPFLRAAFDAIASTDAVHVIRNLRAYEEGDKAHLVAESLNELVTKIRDKMGSAEYKRLFRNHERGINKNRKSLTSWTNETFKKYAKVLVVRVDLSYKRSLQMPWGSQNIDAKEVKRHMAALLKDLKSKLFKGSFITYVWKLEYGLVKGYHYHAFFFFDGSKVMKDIQLAEIIGKHWERVVTEQSGGYFNCNKIKNVYPDPGIGMIDHRETSKRTNLTNKALDYLLKVDYYVRPIAGDGLRSFGKGGIPRRSQKPLGRPRGDVCAKKISPKSPQVEFGITRFTDGRIWEGLCEI